MTTTATTTKALHAEAVEKLASPVFPDGTYNLKTLEAVSFNKGYQVSFCNVGDDYTADDYEFIVAMFTEISVDGVAYLGKFDGCSEISFHIMNKGTAIKYAKMFNQISVFDWSAMDCIPTGGTGRK